MTADPLDVGLLDPASAHAARLVGDRAYAEAMVQAEAALLQALADVGAAPESARDLPAVLDLGALAEASRSGGNPVIPLVQALRSSAPDDVRDLVHLGATSQDILDSAAMVVALGVRRELGRLLPPVLQTLMELAQEHRATPVAGRTLGQQAAPTTFGLRIAVLLDGVARAWRNLEAVELPAQLAGSVGTLAVLVDLLGEDRADRLRDAYAAHLGLVSRPVPWHVERSPIAELGAALAVLIGALGRIGLEIAHGARSEIGELEVSLGAGEGGSSAMPQKRNPVAAVLLVSAARRAPGLASTLLGAQLALDDRPAGDWHAEWQPLRELLRLTVESAALAGEALAVLRVDTERARQNLGLSRGAVHAERAQWALASFFGRERAGTLVREALTASDFVGALIAAAEGEPGGGAAAVRRLGEVTSTSGAVGLSDRIIDAAVDSAWRVP